jgi:hypothetical protein
LARVLEDAGGKLVAVGGISFSTRQPRRIPVTERQLHIRAYRAARGAGLDTDAANAVAHRVVERCITNAPSLHDSHPRIDPLVVDRITRRISLAEQRGLAFLPAKPAY